MALNLKEVFAPAAIAAYWTNDPTNAMPFASDALFPAKKKAGLDLKWLRGHKGVGVSLMPSAFDAKATFRTREGFKFDETEMPFFREGYHLGEKDRQEILRVLDSNDPYARDVMNRLYDDTAHDLAAAGSRQWRSRHHHQGKRCELHLQLRPGRHLEVYQLQGSLCRKVQVERYHRYPHCRPERCKGCCSGKCWRGRD